MSIHPFLLAAAATLSLSAPAVAQTADALKVIEIDVEGGAATLYVTPQGHSLLVDTGWPAGQGGPRGTADKAAPYVLNSAERIVAAAKAAGLSKLDYVLITHYHLDHVGGVPDLVKLIPVGTVIDHGNNHEFPPPGAPQAALTGASATLYPAYLKAIEGIARRSVAAGDKIDIDDLHITVTNAAGALIPTALAGGGAPGVDCAKAVPKAEDGGDENARSVGLFMTYGTTRIFAGGDSIWNIENALVCPTNRIGPIDLYVANHHGSALSNSPQFLKSIAPRVIAMDNGPAKGGDASSLDSFRMSPRLQGLWQLHKAVNPAVKNEPDAHLVNVPEATDGAAMNIAVGKDGTITVTNGRTGRSETYRR
ncbi:MAG: MBL fold metallo-hydrolase [Sphingobium sp.]|nr:MBL fold metallo-hydrolase [Sphingobium sp.]